MLAEFERAVEEAVASRQWPEMRDTRPRQFTIFGYRICQLVNILVTILIVTAFKKGWFYWYFSAYN
jgi:hypothetical protein